MDTTRTPWSRILLPREHGVWGLLAAAALVGLPLGSDLAGCGLLVAAVAAVIGRQAMTARAGWRSVSVAMLAACLAGGGVLLTWRSAATSAWVPWALAGGLVAGIHALLGRLVGRPWWLSGLAGTAFALLAASVAQAGGAPLAWAVTAAAVLAAHLLGTVPQVRACLRPRDPRWPRLTWMLHASSTAAALVAWSCGIVPSAIPLILFLGLVRSAYIVDKRITMSAPARVGAIELAWMPVLAAAVVIGLRG